MFSPHTYIHISHLSWWWMSWWLSAFVWGIPLKKWYRRYKIESIKESEWYSNDYKALKEIIIRRFITKKDSIDANLPDLFILDWGKWQLWIIKELTQTYPELLETMQHTQFVALWKWQARQRKWKSEWATEVLYSLDKNLDVIEQALNYDQTDKILIKIRDEAHRFANQYRKNRMSQQRK